MIEYPPKTLPEYRSDPVTGHWILIASERAYRPISQSSERRPNVKQQDECPFCEGREDQTPPEIFAERANQKANAKGWTLRVLPNAFPAVRGLEASQALESTNPQDPHLLPGFGSHELVVERPDHHWTITDLPVESFAEILKAYRQRMTALHQRPGIAYASVFKNAGAAAGASQEHVHSQILATSLVPPHLFKELVGANAYHSQNAKCIFCDMISQCERENDRIVAQTESFIVLCPYAPRFPYETWILPRKHEGRFERSELDLTELAGVFRSTLLAIESVLEPASYNYFFHSLPTVEKSEDFYHWHIEIAPRLLGIAGIEIGGGVFINPYPPEWTADKLRRAMQSNSAK